MPQEFHVVRCFKCEAFQVQIVKKIPKWECKICGEKQSVRQVYGNGTGKDCRLHVQKLNALRADIIPETMNNEHEISTEFDNINTNIQTDCDTSVSTLDKPTQSKWAEFLDDQIETNDSDSLEEVNTYPKRIKLSDPVGNINSSTQNFFSSNSNQNELDVIQDSKKIINFLNNTTKESLQLSTGNHFANTNSKLLEPSFNYEKVPEDSNKLKRNTVFETLTEKDNLDSIFDTDF